MQIIHSKNLSKKPSSTMSQAPYPPGGYAYGPGQGYQQPGYLQAVHDVRNKIEAYMSLLGLA